MDSDQNACPYCRVSARTTHGTAWLIHSPHTTTATTPEAWIVSASRNAVNGVSRLTTLPSSGSSTRRRARGSRPDAMTAPASAPPPYDSRKSPPMWGTLTVLPRP